MQSGAVYWSSLWWWLGLLAAACLLIGSCVTPDLSSTPEGADKPSGETPPASGTPPVSKTPPAGERPSASEIPPAEALPASKTPPADEASPAGEAIKRQSVPGFNGGVEQNVQPPRERLERRLQAVVTCLEEARQAVIAAEVAGAGLEAVRPALDALTRSEAALREAQAQLLRGEAAQAVSPLDRAAAACRAAREFNQQT